jgi:aryl-alcohol dehydrogenase-like predicted oxidoreductase
VGKIGDMDVFPLCLGGNVFGWTADERESFAVLDAYAEAGGNFLDTADVYTAWRPGNPGGVSERIIGRWLASRGNRAEMRVATKVGMFAGFEGLSARNIRAAAEASLARLQTDRIDLYYAHRDDPETPLEETLGAFDALVTEGKVRHVAASNFSAARLAEALSTSRKAGLARFVALQARYNLMERTRYETELAGLCASEGLACLPYFALARGFLTGKYRPGAEVDSARAEQAGSYLNAHGEQVLAAVDWIAEAHSTTVGSVALAWLAAQPNVAAVVASARTPAQLTELVPMATLELTTNELDLLSRASTFD